jgi:hypothetical protein
MLRALLFLLPAANLAVSSLTGMKAEMAEVALGPPDVARNEARGAMWTYRKADCVLFVYLADKGDGMRITGFSAGPRRAGDQTPTAEACLKADDAPPAVAVTTPPHE